MMAVAPMVAVSIRVHKVDVYTGSSICIYLNFVCALHRYPGEQVHEHAQRGGAGSSRTPASWSRLVRNNTFRGTHPAIATACHGKAGMAPGVGRDAVAVASPSVAVGQKAKLLEPTAYGGAGGEVVVKVAMVGRSEVVTFFA